jgi:nitroreductase
MVVECKQFDSIIVRAFASMVILLTAVNERIGACFVGGFEDNKVSAILELAEFVKPIGIICIDYPAEETDRIERISPRELFYYGKYGKQLD